MSEASYRVNNIRGDLA